MAFRFTHRNLNLLISRRCFAGDIKQSCQNENARVWGVLRAQKLFLSSLNMQISDGPVVIREFKQR